MNRNIQIFFLYKKVVSFKVVSFHIEVQTWAIYNELIIVLIKIAKLSHIKNDFEFFLYVTD